TRRDCSGFIGRASIAKSRRTIRRRQHLRDKGVPSVSPATLGTHIAETFREAENGSVRKTQCLQANGSMARMRLREIELVESCVTQPKEPVETSNCRQIYEAEQPLSHLH